MPEVDNKEIYGKRYADQWKHLKVPLVMSGEEIEIYKRFILKDRLQSKRALLFGATPELRDMLFDLRFDVTLVDINPEMVAAMDMLVKKSKNKEKKIIGDWLKIGDGVEIEDKFGKFDIILGDHFLNHVPFKSFSKLFGIIASLLKEEGLFVTNVVVKIKEPITAEKAIDHFRNRLESFNDLKEKMRWTYLVISNDPRIFDPVSHSANAAGFNKLIKKMHASHAISDKEFDAFYLNEIGDTDMYFTFVTDELFREEAIKFFDILGTDVAKGHKVFQHHRIYAMKPKQ